MECNKNKVINTRISKTIENLKKNNMNAVYVPTKVEALALLKTLLKGGETIAVGGSVTLNETGALDYIRNGKFNFIDRYDKTASREEILKRLKEGLTADTFIMSTNAITEGGYLYNVDGSGNRVAPLIYGPDRVIILAGYNKIVPTLRDAVERVKNMSAPANCIRLDCDTYCEKNGKCIRNICDGDELMAIPAGSCENTICCSSVVSGRQRIKDRITVIIVGEELGY